MSLARTSFGMDPSKDGGGTTKGVFVVASEVGDRGRLGFIFTRCNTEAATRDRDNWEAPMEAPINSILPGSGGGDMQFRR